MNEIIKLAGKPVVLPRNLIFCSAGDVNTNIYFIESGSVKVFVLAEDKEQIVRFGYKGNLIVALDAFLTGKPTEFYIQTLKKTTVRVVSKPVFQDFLNESQTSKALWTAILEDLVLQQMDRELDLLNNSPAERYKRVLNRSPKLFQEIPHKHIANYLRMTPETLSRLKKS